MSEINIKNMLDNHIFKLDKIIKKKEKYVNIINNLSKQINKIKLNNTELKSKLKEIEIQLNNKEQILLIEIKKLKKQHTEELNEIQKQHEKELKEYQKQINRLNNIHGLNDDEENTVKKQVNW